VHNVDSDRCEIVIHALTSFSTPQTLNIAYYIKKQKVIVLIDWSSTHNFIDKILAENLNCFVYPVTNFQFLVVIGGSIDYMGKCHNIKLSMGEYLIGNPNVCHSHWRCICCSRDSMVENIGYNFYKL
jgi:hypothetical protein